MSKPAEREPSTLATFAVPPIVKTIDLACAPRLAFDLFVREMTSWWPLASHSLGGAKAASVAIEPRVGGRVFEREVGGVEHLWGTVLAWDEPRRVVFTWHVGRAADSTQTIELSFAPSPAGTRVRLVHAGWHALAPGAPDRRGEYVEGWDDVFVRRYGGFAARAAAAGATARSPSTSPGSTP